MEGYEEQFWENENPESQVNATRMTHIEKGIKNAYNVSLIAITNIEPSECNEGDKYFNTSDNLIYTATDTDTWSETGETPISDKTYVLTTDGSTYMYDGTTLTRIGGSEQVVSNEYSESTEIPYSCDYVNGKILDFYSLTEVKTNKIWTNNKPIYRKVVHINSLPNNDSTYYDHNITNIDEIIDIHGRAWRAGDATMFPIAFTNSTGLEFMIAVWCTRTTFTIKTGMDRSNCSADITIEYTKTTS